MFRTQFNYDRDAASNETALKDFEEGGAQQQFKKDCDINVIVARFGVTGELPQGVRAPMYGDFTGVGDYRSALEAVKLAEESFMQMDAFVRRRFHDDPQAFVEFCSKPENLSEMEKMGLTKGPKSTPEPVKGEVKGSGTPDPVIAP